MQLQRPFEGALDLADRHHRLALGPQRRQDEGKLAGAHPRHLVSLTQTIANPVGDLNDEIVPFAIPELNIKITQPLYLDQDQSNQARVAALSTQRLLEIRQKLLSVGQTSKWVLRHRDSEALIGL